MRSRPAVAHALLDRGYWRDMVVGADPDLGALRMGGEWRGATVLRLRRALGSLNEGALGWRI